MSHLSQGPTSSQASPGGPGFGLLLLLIPTSLFGAAAWFSYRTRTSPVLAGHGVAWWVLPFGPVTLVVAAAVLFVIPAACLFVRRWRGLAMPAALPGSLVLLLAHGPLPSPIGAAVQVPGLLANPATRPSVLPMAAEAAAGFCLLLAIGAALQRSAHRRSSAAEVAHGTARFATRSDLRAADLLSGHGVVLGTAPSALGGRPLTDRSADHVLIVMPPGGGKTTGPVACSLLNLDGPALVLDPKGELWTLTSGWVSHRDGLAIRFAPHQGAETCCWNPLDEIPKGEEEIGLVTSLAENLITYPAQVHGENHWTASARSLLRCLVLHVLYAEDEPTFGAVRDLLMSEPDHDALFDSLATAEHDRDGSFGWRDSKGSTRTHPEVARLARTFRATPDRERGSIVSTLARFLDLWGDPQVRAATSRSDWSLELLTRAERPATVYVTVPSNRLAAQAPLLRILITLLAHRVTSGSEDGFRDREAFGTGRLHLVLDEFAALGRIPVLEEMLAFFRGYGVRCVLAVQDLSQLRRLYGPRPWNRCDLSAPRGRRVRRRRDPRRDLTPARGGDPLVPQALAVGRLAVCPQHGLPGRGFATAADRGRGRRSAVGQSPHRQGGPPARPRPTPSLLGPPGARAACCLPDPRPPDSAQGRGG